MVPIVDTDVLVIGGGGAGARAALSAAESGARVMLALKGLLGRSGATAYRVSSVGRFQAATGLADPDDTPAEHFRDIVSAAQGMCSERLARVVASEAPRVLDDLVARGVELDTVDGRPREGDHPLHRGGRAAVRAQPRSTRDHGRRLRARSGRGCRSRQPRVRPARLRRDPSRHVPAVAAPVASRARDAQRGRRGLPPAVPAGRSVAGGVRGPLWHRGSWGGQRLSLGDYVTGMGAARGATAAGGRSC